MLKEDFRPRSCSHPRPCLAGRTAGLPMRGGGDPVSCCCVETPQTKTLRCRLRSCRSQRGPSLNQPGGGGIPSDFSPLLIPTAVDFQSSALAERDCGCCGKIAAHLQRASATPAKIAVISETELKSSPHCGFALQTETVSSGSLVRYILTAGF